jgi:hypothetical protein
MTLFYLYWIQSNVSHWDLIEYVANQSDEGIVEVDERHWGFARVYPNLSFQDIVQRVGPNWDSYRPHYVPNAPLTYFGVWATTKPWEVPRGYKYAKEYRQAKKTALFWAVGDTVA